MGLSSFQPASGLQQNITISLTDPFKNNRTQKHIMTEAQNRKFTQRKNDIDRLEVQLIREVEANQQRIAPLTQGDHGYQKVFELLVDSQKRRYIEPNTLTFSLISDIVKVSCMDWDEAVRRNNKAQDAALKGEGWVRAIKGS